MMRVVVAASILGGKRGASVGVDLVKPESIPVLIAPAPNSMRLVRAGIK